MNKQYIVLKRLPGGIEAGTILVFDPKSGMYQCKVFGKIRRILPVKVETQTEFFAPIDDETI